MTILCDRELTPTVGAVRLPYEMLATTPALALIALDADADAIKADARCVVLVCDEPKHETGRLALRAWLTAKGLTAEELTAAAGTLGAPKTGQSLLDGLKAHLLGKAAVPIKTEPHPKDT